MFVGFHDDWRTGMEEFAGRQSRSSRRSWRGPTAFLIGWNSWGVLQTEIRFTNAVAVSEFFRTNLTPNSFANDGTVYINLDAWWNDNFSNAWSAKLCELLPHQWPEGGHLFRAIRLVWFDERRVVVVGRGHGQRLSIRGHPSCATPTAIGS